MLQKDVFFIAGVISLLMAFILTALQFAGVDLLFGLPVAAFSMPFFSILVHGLCLLQQACG